MSMTTQLAVRMNDDQLADLDWIVIHLKLDSRADGIRRAVELVTKRLRDEEIDREYLKAYTELPLTDEEMAEAERHAVESIDEEPWEKWW